MILLFALMLGETSCVVRVKGRAPRPRARGRVKVRVYAPPAEKSNDQYAYLSFKHATDIPE